MKRPSGLVGTATGLPARSGLDLTRERRAGLEVFTGSPQTCEESVDWDQDSTRSTGHQADAAKLCRQ